MTKDKKHALYLGVKMKVASC